VAKDLSRGVTENRNGITELSGYSGTGNAGWKTGGKAKPCRTFLLLAQFVRRAVALDGELVEMPAGTGLFR
jgi:hypothetical protein